MWAQIGRDGKTVIGSFPPDVPEEIVYSESEAAGYTVVKMTLENSPAWVYGTYVDGKFYPPEGTELPKYIGEKNA